MISLWHVSGRVLNGLVSALIVLASLAIYVPLAPIFPDINLDSGWAYAVNVAVANGMVFGRDIVFTFGPYASAYTEQYFPATDVMMLWSAAILGLAFAAGLLCLAHGWRRLSALLLAVFLAPLARDALFFAIPFACLLVTCRMTLPDNDPARLAPTRAVRLSLALLVVALSLIPLVKGTFAAASAIVMALCWLVLMLRGHRALALAGLAIFAISMPVLWVIAHQPLAALPGFFLAQSPIISGYTDAMSTPGGLLLPLQFIVCCGLICLLHLRGLTLLNIVLLAGSAALLFFAFKGGFVRPDGHMLIPAGLIALVGWMLTFGRPGWRPMLGLAVGLASWAMIDRHITGLTLPSLVTRLEAPFGAAAHAAVRRVRTPEALSETFADNITRIRAQQGLPPLPGTSDIYSYGQSILLAHGLDWDPRPVLQSYSAYTPSLERDDADHLAGAAAPDNILFAVQPIDGHLPALEDGASWPALLSRYEFVDLAGSLAILRRRDAAPAPVIDAAAPDSIARLGEPIALPAMDGPVWARIEVTPTWLGKLVGVLYKPPRLSVVYRFPDGHAETYRYIAGMAAAGFLAAPLVRTTNDFIALALPDANNDLAANRPVTITVTADHGIGWLWRGVMNVAFAPVHIPAQPNASRILFDRVETAAERLVKLPTTTDCAIDLINQHRPEHLPVPVGHFLQVDGWAAISVKEAAAPDATALTLTAPDGAVTLVKARKIARDDVNRYFQKPAMGQVGYTSFADLSGLTGDFLLGLQLTLGDQAWTCATQIPIHVGEPDAASR